MLSSQKGDDAYQDSHINLVSSELEVSQATFDGRSEAQGSKCSRFICKSNKHEGQDWRSALERRNDDGAVRLGEGGNLRSMGFKTIIYLHHAANGCSQGGYSRSTHRICYGEDTVAEILVCTRD